MAQHVHDKAPGVLRFHMMIQMTTKTSARVFFWLCFFFYEVQNLLIRSVNTVLGVLGCSFDFIISVERNRTRLMHGGNGEAIE